MHSNYRLLTFSYNFMFSCSTQNSVFEFIGEKKEVALKVKKKKIQTPEIGVF